MGKSRKILKKISRKILKKKGGFTRKHKISKKLHMMKGGSKYQTNIIANAAKMYFGTFAETRFPIVKISLGSLQKTGKFFSMTGSSFTRVVDKLYLMTPGTVFKSEYLKANFLQRQLNSARESAGIDTYAKRSELFIVIDFILSKKVVVGIKYLPLYQLSPDFKDEKVLLQGNKNPKNANGKICRPKTPTYGKYETLFQNLTAGQVADKQKLLEKVTGARLKTVLSQECSIPGTPATCELGFAKRQNEKLVGPDGCYSIVTDVKGIYLNGAVSTKVDDIQIVGYDRIDMNQSCEYLHTVASLVGDLDKKANLDQLTTRCVSALKQFLDLNVEIIISNRGLTQIAALCDQSYKPEEYIVYNAGIADDEMVNFDGKAGNFDRGLNQLFGDLVTANVDATPVTDITAVQKLSDQYIAANSGMDMSVIGDLICHVALFRLLNINDYKFEISFPELIFLCKTYMIKSATDNRYFADDTDRDYKIINELYVKICKAVDNTVYNPAKYLGAAAGAVPAAGAAARAPAAGAAARAAPLTPPRAPAPAPRAARAVPAAAPAPPPRAPVRSLTIDEIKQAATLGTTVFMDSLRDNSNDIDLSLAAVRTAVEHRLQTVTSDNNEVEKVIYFTTKVLTKASSDATANKEKVERAKDIVEEGTRASIDNQYPDNFVTQLTVHTISMTDQVYSSAALDSNEKSEVRAHAAQFATQAITTRQPAIP